MESYSRAPSSQASSSASRANKALRALTILLSTPVDTEGCLELLTKTLIKCSKRISASITFTVHGNGSHTLGAEVTELQHETLPQP